MVKITKKQNLSQSDDSLHEVLYKKALGYKIKETTDEYALDDDELKLTKRKVCVKYYPPDLEALQLLKQYDQLNANFATMTDEQLEQEKQKLLTILRQETKED